MKDQETLDVKDRGSPLTNSTVLDNPGSEIRQLKKGGGGGGPEGEKTKSMPLCTEVCRKSNRTLKNYD